MYFLKTICETSTILKAILFTKELLKIIFIIIPIGLIVMLTIDIFKTVITGNDENMKKNINLAIKRIFMAILVFFIPTIVNIINNIITDAELLTNTDIDYTICLENANTETIKAIEEEEKNEKLSQEINTQTNLTEDFKETDTPYTSTTQNINPLPDEDKYYPLNGLDMNGNQTEILKIDGKYLTEAEMDNLDAYIKESINNVGDNWKTRIAAAAYALIFGLNEKGLRLIYEYSGGSGSLYKTECSYGSFCKKWGEINYKKVCANGCYQNTYRGLDCAGFVKFAISAGCGVSFNYQASSYARLTDLSKLEPGDVLITDGHVMMFMKMSEDGQYIVAQSTRTNDYGTVFSKKKTLNGYKIIDLEEAYNSKCVKN